MLLRVVMLGLGVAGCRVGLEEPYQPPACVVSTRPVCVAAEGYQDFASITENILGRNCTGSSCHQNDSSSVKAKRLIFDATVMDKVVKVPATTNAFKSMVSDPGSSAAHVSATGQILSDLETAEDIPLVEPGDPARSYLLFAMHGVSPSEFAFAVAAKPPQVGFMPYNGGTLCCQKLDAIRRWIVAGAHNDQAP